MHFLPAFSIRWLDILDILIVAAFLYQILLWLKGTGGMQLLRGMFIIFILYLVSQQLELNTLKWLLERFVTVILIVIIIVFQPELRRGLERLGRGRFMFRMKEGGGDKGSKVVKELIDTVMILSTSKIGALIILERNTGLNEFLESGVKIDGLVSTELLVSIFNPKTMLHDGAVIVQDERIVAAGCLLPLSTSESIDKRLGTRHRAAVGITEHSDAFVIIVSEETGVISIASDGYLTRFLSRDLLEEKLFEVYGKKK